jgi:sulfite exporter TauE/SafE
LSVLPIDFQHFLPWVSFVAGIGGSLHCVAMCGGLVSATCSKSSDIRYYQIGRLMGYLGLGAFAGYLGSFLKFENTSPLFTLIPGISIGVLFMFWGIKNLKGKKAELPMPKFMGKFYGVLWKNLVYKNINFSKSFLTGLISIFLPCGLLYGIILASVSLQHPLLSLISMLFFWLGTLPSMIIAPSIIQKFLTPLQVKLPKTYASSLILIGILTITVRVVNLNKSHANHAGPATLQKEKKQPSKMSCH